MVELTVPYESRMEEAHAFKEGKYLDLTKELKRKATKLRAYKRSKQRSKPKEKFRVIKAINLVLLDAATSRIANLKVTKDMAQGMEVSSLDAATSMPETSFIGLDASSTCPNIHDMPESHSQVLFSRTWQRAWKWALLQLAAQFSIRRLRRKNI
ncbi:hypothetical protein PoB_005073000 [Plakobranchus ocellatus]|uniref:Uncharacterized protein n=1 Tax=Plakobranchus ocellatus TaxID=259542 RepID=A0AAV4BYJ2_9GAST|nr:hypothetical protein PoB_005073000 [Plakobranchus ocellatus]